METISILFAPFLVQNDNIYLEKTLFWAKKHSPKTYIFTIPQNDCAIFGDAQIVKRDDWDASILAQEIALCCKKENAQTAVFSWADTPFLNDDLTEELLKTHEECIAEYTFADGFPYGLSPEIIDGGVAAIIAELSKGKNIVADRNALMNAMKGDINSFEIETVLSNFDFRQLRISLCASTKSGNLACSSLMPLLNGSESAQQIAEIAANEPKVLRTIPFCFDIQISAKKRHKTLYGTEKAGFDFSDLQDMNLSDFSRIIDEIADINPDAVICPSLFCEPFLRDDFLEVAKIVLSKKLKIVIETDGISITEKIADEFAFLPYAKENLDFIITLDAFSSEMYRKIRGGSSDEFEKAKNAVSILSERFPKRVFPQFLRMNANEGELESFYRFWHDEKSASNGNVIIKKFDSLCSRLGDEKPADLSPLERIPCWHLARDIAILANGDVPLCRSAVRSKTIANALKDGIQAVWDAGFPIFSEHLKSLNDGIFSGINESCGACDEYYTFSF